MNNNLIYTLDVDEANSLKSFRSKQEKSDTVNPDDEVAHAVTLLLTHNEDVIWSLDWVGENIGNVYWDELGKLYRKYPKLRPDLAETLVVNDYIILEVPWMRKPGFWWVRRFFLTPPHLIEWLTPESIWKKQVLRSCNKII